MELQPGAPLTRLMRLIAGLRPSHVWLAVLFALVFAIHQSPPEFRYDERYYMESAYFLLQNGDVIAVLKTPLDLAAGPLYATVHALASPITALQAHGIRYFNLFLAAGAVWAVARTLRELGYGQTHSRAAMMFAVPFLVPTLGLALTEAPSLFAASLSCLAAVKGIRSQSEPWSWAFWIGAGLSAGLAVLGRQTYLPALIGFFIVALAERRFLIRSLTALICALLVIAPMVLVWRGLTPPGQPAAAHGLVLSHGLLAVIYFATACLFIAPGFAQPLFQRKGWQICVPLSIALALLCYAGGLRFPVGKYFMFMVPTDLRELTQTALLIAMTGVGIFFIFISIAALYNRRLNRTFIAFALMTFVTMATPLAIGHQFSSRYVLATLPFVLFMIQPWFSPGPWASLRLVLGASLGVVSLAGYYWRPGTTHPQFTLSAPSDIIKQMPLSADDKAVALRMKETDISSLAKPLR